MTSLALDCRGRPVGAVEEHVYICEYRVDKTARLFNRIARTKHPVCTKWFAFDCFDEKLKPVRNYTVSKLHECTSVFDLEIVISFFLQPHEVPQKWRTSSTPRSRSLEDDGRNRSASNSSTRKGSASSASRSQSNSNAKQNNQAANKMALLRKRDANKKVLKKKNNVLEETLARLRNQLPGAKSPIDASYLLESDKRLRNKNKSSNSSNLLLNNQT